jgi:predicted DNA-binding antitoxin AbrB/MazE fold protein
MSQIEAIYRHGVFEPLEPVHLEEDQRVRLRVEPADKEALEEWLERVQRRQAEIFRRQGYLPDSAQEIAEDRAR